MGNFRSRERKRCRQLEKLRRAFIESFERWAAPEGKVWTEAKEKAWAELCAVVARIVRSGHPLTKFADEAAVVLNLSPQSWEELNLMVRAFLVQKGEIDRRMAGLTSAVIFLRLAEGERRLGRQE